MVGISEGEAEQSVWLGNCLFCKAWQISDYADFVFHLRKNMNTWLNYWVLRLTTRICIGEHSGKGMQANMFRSPAKILFHDRLDWCRVWSLCKKFEHTFRILNLLLSASLGKCTPPAFLSFLMNLYCWGYYTCPPSAFSFKFYSKVKQNWLSPLDSVQTGSRHLTVTDSCLLILRKIRKAFFFFKVPTLKVLVTITN